MTRTRVVIVEDHDLIRHGLGVLLQRSRAIALVGEAGTVAEGLSVLAAVQPDVALVDLGLPDGSGLTLVKASRAQWPDVRVIILSSRDDADAIGSAFASGASAYLAKSCSAPQLVAAIEAVAQGHRYVTQQVGEKLAQWASSPKAARIEILSPRQRQILRLVAEGQTTKAIAIQLGISVTTVNTHRAEIMRRLDIHDVASLTRFAAEQGLLLRR